VGTRGPGDRDGHSETRRRGQPYPAHWPSPLKKPNPHTPGEGRQRRRAPRRREERRQGAGPQRRRAGGAPGGSRREARAGAWARGCCILAEWATTGFGVKSLERRGEGRLWGRPGGPAKKQMRRIKRRKG
jgi:hypothetical protein